MLLQQEQRQVITQRIDPKIILANSILQLTTLELTQSIENELLENPALEALEDSGCPGDCIDPLSCPYCSSRRNRDEAQNAETLDSGDHESESEMIFDANPMEGADEFDLVGNLEAEHTLQEHLRSLMRAAIPAEEYWVGEYLINSLDDRGWLDASTEEIAVELGVPETTVCRLLTTIQSFDPPGVGARNLRECLLIQLEFLHEPQEKAEEPELNSLATRLVRDHWDHLCGKRYSKMARMTGVSVEEVKQAITYIRSRLNPFPASQFRPPWTYRPSNSKSTVRPDVIIRSTQLGYEVDVLGMEPLCLSVSNIYRDTYNLIKSGEAHLPDDEKKHFVEYVERAELFIRNVTQRLHTLRQITKAIIDVQTGFLETGSRQFLRPLTRTRIAQMLSMHESTVSRATANKYVQLPNQEVIGFDVFFNSSLSVKDAILELLQDEDPAHPLSDKRIAEILRERGLIVERRTVVKYREALKILSSTRRRG